MFNEDHVIYRYKYLPFSEGSLKALTEGTMKFTCPLDFNDPFDCLSHTVEDDRENYGELRLQSLAMWRGRVVFLVWTERDGVAHLISCRYADRSQIETYFTSL